MDMLRVTARWSGFQGAPGYSNFFFDANSAIIDGGLFGEPEAQSAAGRVAAAFGAMDNVLPGNVSIDIDPEVSVIDSDTGMASNILSIDPPATVTGRDSYAYSAASGGVVIWRTQDLRSGRRIQGRTFLVPLTGGAYEEDGTMSTAGLSNLRSFADELVDEGLGPELGVWSRPVNGAGGVFATVTGYTVPDKVAILRSRRD